MTENKSTIQISTWILSLSNDICCKNIVPLLQEIYNEFNPISEDSTSLLISSINKLINSTENNFEKFEYELSYKVYYNILTLSNINIDSLFYSNLNEIDTAHIPYILNGILFTNFHSNLNHHDLYKNCLQVFQNEIKGNFKNLKIVIKALNLYCKKYDTYFTEITLKDYYICLQNGIRDETLLLFEYCLKPLEKVEMYLKNIIENWSWTNKNKYFLLSSILKFYKFTDLQRIVNLKLFFEGLRTSLNLKYLFSAGQNLIKAINEKNSTKEFHKFIIDILWKGSHTEIQNFNSQWIKYIKIEQLYNEYIKQFNIEKFESYLLEDKLRFIIICNIFQSELIENKEIINKLFIILVKTLYEKESDTRIHVYVYTFVVNSSNSLCLSDTLDYLIHFYNQCIIIPCPDFRQTIFSKFPQILNILSKRFSKIPKEQFIIIDFIKKLIKIINDGLNDWNDYQKLIFTSKLLICILKFINTNSSKKKGKIICNQNLIKCLTEMLDFVNIRKKIFNTFELIEFNDIREMFIEILLQLKYNDVDVAFNEARNKNSSSDVDICYLSAFYIRIALNADTLSRNIKKECFLVNVHSHKCPTLFQEQCLEYLINRLNKNMENFESDPYWNCKKGRHLFGSLGGLTEIYKVMFVQDIQQFSDLVFKIDTLVELVLKLLNIASTKNDISASPSFEVMDESLQLLLEKSQLKSNNFYQDRKFLLFSFWTTLKFCCDLATIIGMKLLYCFNDDDEIFNIFEKCLYINFKVLQRCRLKGAIEAAGISLGILVKKTSIQHSTKSQFYQKIFTCFSILFGNVNNISNTRRGAGLSIMFHHILKNDFQKRKPLFHCAIKIILSYVKKIETPPDDKSTNLQNSICNDQHDNFNAVVLHYLCRIVKDTELRNLVSEYYDDILMAAITRIEHSDWRVRNAALQVFGGIVPKIVGQQQESSDFIKNWQPTNTNFLEIEIKLPNTCIYILEYCQKINDVANSTSTILLFLQFFSNIEYIKISENISQFVTNFREIYWTFLSHPCEKVRKLSAICMVRSHDFNSELPSIIFKCMEIYFEISNPNFEQGLLYTIIEGIHKLIHEKANEIDEFLRILRQQFIYFYCKKKLNFYQKMNMLNFLKQVKFNLKSKFINEILQNFEINNFTDKYFWEV